MGFLLFLIKIKISKSYLIYYKQNISIKPLLARSFFTDFQRLESENLMWFVGFVEGDGSFSVNKNGRYIKYEFNIELSTRDVELLYKIKSMLGKDNKCSCKEKRSFSFRENKPIKACSSLLSFFPVGSITFRTRDNTQMARLKIASKKDLINRIIGKNVGKKGKILFPFSTNVLVKKSFAFLFEKKL